MSRYTTSSLNEEPLGYEGMRERQRNHRKYKKKRDEYDDDESEDEKDGEVLPRWKIITVFAIIGICFAMLFPSLFGPVFSSLFGRGGAQTQQAQQPHHPFMDRGAGQAPRPSGPSHRGPPPRMPQAEIPQSSGRGGFMSWMLPVYTIGVMGFLVYTLFKMNRKKKKKRRRYDDESDYSQEDSEESDPDGIGRKKLRSIQKKLHETEEAMAKILEQLEEVAQAAPETLTPDELRKKYSAEQLRQTEFNLQELNRLNEIRSHQQRLIEEEGGKVSGAEEEENGDDDLKFFQQQVNEAKQEPPTQNNKNVKKSRDKKRKPTTEAANSSESENEAPIRSNVEPIKDEPVHQSDIEENLLGNDSEDEASEQEQKEEVKIKMKQFSKKEETPNQLRRRNQKTNDQQKSKKNREKKSKSKEKSVEEPIRNEEHVHQSDIEDNLMGNDSDENEEEHLPKIVECEFTRKPQKSKSPEDSKNKNQKLKKNREKKSKSKEKSVEEPIHNEEPVHQSDIEDNLLGNDSDENEQEHLPKIVECEFTRKPQKSKSPEDSKNQPDTSTAFENQLFDFGGSNYNSSNKNNNSKKNQKKQAAKKENDYEAPPMLDDLLGQNVDAWGGPQMHKYQDEIKNEAGTTKKEENESEDEVETNQEAIVDDRPNRRAKRKKPFGEKAVKVDEAKLQEQKQIVEGLAYNAPPQSKPSQNEPIIQSVEEKKEESKEEEEKPKQEQSSGSKPSNKSKSRRVRKAD